MSLVSLRPVTFYNAVVSGSSNGNWIRVDSAFGGIQQRSVIGSKDTANTVEVQLKIIDGAFEVICTATSWGAGVTNFSAIITGPFHQMRIRNLGGNGTAGTSVIGLV